MYKFEVFNNLDGYILWHIDFMDNHNRDVFLEDIRQNTEEFGYSDSFTKRALMSNVIIDKLDEIKSSLHACHIMNAKLKGVEGSNRYAYSIILDSLENPWMTVKEDKLVIHAGGTTDGSHAPVIQAIVTSPTINAILRYTSAVPGCKLVPLATVLQGIEDPEGEEKSADTASINNLCDMVLNPLYRNVLWTC